MSSPKPTLDGLRIERGAEREPQSKSWLVIAVVMVLLALGAVVWWHSKAGAIEVQTALARDSSSGGDRTVLNASGYVTARREATVSSKVTGKVTEVLIEEGMKVTNNQVVARLDDSNVKASLDVAKAQLESAKAALAETEAQLKDADKNFSERPSWPNNTSRRNPTWIWPRRMPRRCRRIWRSRNSTSSSPNARWPSGSSNWMT